MNISNQLGYICLQVMRRAIIGAWRSCTGAFSKPVMGRLNSLVPLAALTLGTK